MPSTVQESFPVKVYLALCSIYSLISPLLPLLIFVRPFEILHALQGFTKCTADSAYASEEQ